MSNTFDDIGYDFDETKPDTTIISYENEARKRAEAAQTAARDAENQKVFDLLCNEYDISDTFANMNVIRGFCGGEITPEKFVVMLQTPGEADSLDWTQTKQRLISEIADLILDPTGRRMNDHQLKTEVKKMWFWTRAALRARLADIKFRRGKTAQDARDLLASHRAAERGPFYPFEHMPDTITPQVILAAYNSQAGRERVRVWNQKYGAAQVEARRQRGLKK